MKFVPMSDIDQQLAELDGLSAEMLERHIRDLITRAKVGNLRAAITVVRLVELAAESFEGDERREEGF